MSTFGIWTFGPLTESEEINRCSIYLGDDNDSDKGYYVKSGEEEDS